MQFTFTTYLDSNGEEKDNELHGSLVASDWKSVLSSPREGIGKEPGKSENKRKK
jgi:hypothetical protein